MNQIEELNLLIDKASAIAGSDYRLAKMIGAMPQNVSNWRHDRASCSPENRALLAAVAGLDPVAELARATLDKHQGTSKGDLLMKALGKSSRLTGAIAGIVGAVVLAISSLIPQRVEAMPVLKPAHNECYVKYHCVSALDFSGFSLESI